MKLQLVPGCIIDFFLNFRDLYRLFVYIFGFGMVYFEVFVLSDVCISDFDY